MSTRALALALAMTTAASMDVGAQSTPAAIPPIRPLGRIVRVSQDSLTYIASIRVLSDGRVLANDTQGKRVVLFDSSLTHFVPVMDATGTTARAYGATGGWLLPFRGDSSIFADYAALALVVIDPAGKIARVMAGPGGPGGRLGYIEDAEIDPQGNVVSQQTAAAAANMGRGAGGPVGIGGRAGGGGVAAMPGAAMPGAATQGSAGNAPARGQSAPPGVSASGTASAPGQLPPPALSASDVLIRHDSTVILRVNIETRKVDTAAWLMAPVAATALSGTRRIPVGNPFPISDAWAMLPDGTVAAVRELDYHVDWVSPTGAVTSTPRIAHQWVQITDSMKLAIIDSVRQSDSTATVRLRKQTDSMLTANHIPSSRPPQIFVSTGPDRTGAMYSGGEGATGQYLAPDDLPSYFPPFPPSDTLGVSPAQADADGNLWIRVNFTKRPDGGFVYDVVNRRGVLVDRVQLPGGTHLMGFGPGVAYLISRDGTRYALARARIR